MTAQGLYANVQTINNGIVKSQDLKTLNTKCSGFFVFMTFVTYICSVLRHVGNKKIGK